MRFASRGRHLCRVFRPPSHSEARAMLIAMHWEMVESSLWSAACNLVVLAIVGVVANLIYRRFRDLMTARQELLDDIDLFSLALYKPRKLYQIMIDRAPDLLAGVATREEREARRLEAIHHALEDLVEATGRFRTLQVEIIRLYGYNMDLLSRYLAIWRYLKEVRRRMEAGVALYLPGEKPGSEDAFYKLFDAFRFRVSVARFVLRAPKAAQPPADILAHMRREGDVVFAEYFGEADKGPPPPAA
jgi:hypothetical protein